jgi:hypothetical protein
MNMPRSLPMLSVLALVAAIFRAARLDAASLVTHDRVDPHWFAGVNGETNRFWYRIESGRDQHEFILVDAAEGKRTSAFDHARVAEALAKVTGRPVSPRNLPLMTSSSLATANRL